MKFDEWLSTQRMHQATHHDVKYRELACDPYQMSRYVLTQIHEALTTMETARMNIPSHGVDEATQRKAWEDNRSSFVDNIVSMLGCVGSMLTAVGTTDEELARRYTDKLGMDAALRRLSLAADPGVWVCAVCKNEIPDAVDGYVSVPRGIRVCSKVCLNSLPAPESVLVPGPDVSAIDLSEDPEDEEDLDG